MSAQFKLTTLNKQYAAQTATILAEAFMDEPMQTVLDTTFEDILEFMEHIVQHAIPTGLSAIAIDTETDKVVGISINKDLLDEPIGKDDRFSEKLFPIFELLDQLDNKYHEYYEVKPNEIYHNMMLAIDSKYRNNDITTLFFNFCTDIAYKKGFKTMLAETTGPISFHVVTKKLGFKELYSIKYADFYFNGTYPFKNIKGAEYCYLLHRPVPSK